MCLTVKVFGSMKTAQTQVKIIMLMIVIKIMFIFFIVCLYKIIAKSIFFVNTDI